MHPHFHHAHRCGRATARFFWFALGAGAATWWHCHHDAHAWHQARACWRDRIPQNAYPAPGSAFPVSGPPPPSGSDAADPRSAPPPTTAQVQGQGQGQGQQGTWERWGWGPWGRDARAQHQQQQQQQQDPHGRPGWGAWGARDNRPEGAWGPPMPVPGTFERPGQGEKDIVQQATDTVRRGLHVRSAELS